MKKINILLPIESIDREIDYKLFLAVSLAGPNVNVIVAQHDYFNTGTSAFKGGIYIGKNVFKSLFPKNSFGSEVDLHFLKELKNNDITIFHLDEEGAIFSGDEKSWEVELGSRLNPKVLMEDDYIFAWGSFQKKIYQKKNPLLPSSHVIDTGTPRFELCKPKFHKYFQEKIDEIKAKYGSFILINTNFDRANGLIGIKEEFSGYNPSWVFCSKDDPQIRLKFINWWSYQRKMQANMVALLHKLSIAFPDKNFVLRPHPGEDPNFYEVVFETAKNVFVNKTGTVQPWLMAADLLVHDCCTTAVESFLAETPIINYRPIEDEDFDVKFPNQCGTKCESEDEVIEAINNMRHDREGFIKKNSLTPSSKSLLKNIENDVYDDFIELVKKMSREKLAGNSCDGNISIRSMRYREIGNSLEQFSRRILRAFFYLKRLRYAAAKVHFSGFQRGLVVKNLKVIEGMLNKKVELDYLSDRLLIISSEEKEDIL